MKEGSEKREEVGIEEREEVGTWELRLGVEAWREVMEGRLGEDGALEESGGEA